MKDTRMIYLVTAQNNQNQPYNTNNFCCCVFGKQPHEFQKEKTNTSVYLYKYIVQIVQTHEMVNSIKK